MAPKLWSQNYSLELKLRMKRDGRSRWGKGLVTPILPLFHLSFLVRTLLLPYLTDDYSLESRGL